MEDRQAYERAKKRAEAKIGFYIHAAVYVAVNCLLMVINFTTSPEFLWFYWPMIGWGIGLFFHGLGVFALSEDSPLKQRMIAKELDKQSDQGGSPLNTDSPERP